MWCSCINGSTVINVKTNSSNNDTHSCLSHNNIHTYSSDDEINACFPRDNPYARFSHPDAYTRTSHDHTHKYSTHNDTYPWATGAGDIRLDWGLEQQRYRCLYALVADDADLDRGPHGVITGKEAIRTVVLMEMAEGLKAKVSKFKVEGNRVTYYYEVFIGGSK